MKRISLTFSAMQPSAVVKLLWFSKSTNSFLTNPLRIRLNLKRQVFYKTVFQLLVGCIIIGESFSHHRRLFPFFLVKSLNNRPRYFAERLHLAMKGFGTDDDALIRIIVSRCEIDLGNIIFEYERIYDKTLFSAVKVNPY